MANNLSDTMRSDSETILNIHLAIVVFFAGSLVLGDYGNRFFVYILQVELHHRFLAGFIEPILTKFLPTILVLGLFEWKNVPVDYVRAHPYRLAFFGGLSVGLFERILFIFVRNATISLGFILAAVVHVVNALLIAGLIFSTPEKEQDWMFTAKLIGVILLAILIHVGWNGWGAIWVAEMF